MGWDSRFTSFTLLNHKLEENVIPEGCSLNGSVIQLDNIFRKLVINFSVKFGFPENVIQPDNSLVWWDFSHRCCCWCYCKDNRTTWPWLSLMVIFTVNIRPFFTTSKRIWSNFAIHKASLQMQSLSKIGYTRINLIYSERIFGFGCDEKLFGFIVTWHRGKQKWMISISTSSAQAIQNHQIS